MNKFVDTTHTETHTLIWVTLSDFPEAYYAISDDYDISTLMCADENHNGDSLDNLSQYEKQEIADVIQALMKKYPLHKRPCGLAFLVRNIHV